MSMPGFTAAASLSRNHAESRAGVAAVESNGSPEIVPQVSVCSPCIRVGGNRFCVNLPIIGQRCFNVPVIGSWKACCSVSFPFRVRCNVQRC